jgi:lysozyme family protein
MILALWLYSFIKDFVMANFGEAIVKTLAKEGGSRFTNVSSDKGGATKYGISQAAYPTLDIPNLTEQQARDIYKRDYWDRVRGDDIKSDLIAENIFDTAVNMGVRTASRLVQITLSIDPADGIIGSASLAVINQQDEKIFIANFTLAKIARYAHICNKDSTQNKFLLGWINRALGGAV